ncbi:M16 family metallopeptidase [Pontibaca methylaminivorans]|uniref:Zinc protease n=1 Tax=Pontibaca methylaminivorans TaxID=515897 RepID=A0A1R3WZ47_9RHOB|nr:pitrilysin family protein [Pontibaca methylaminivorans]SIT83397.1 zinc protease [Pontibaca methylaminivorans]
MLRVIVSLAVLLVWGQAALAAEATKEAVTAFRLENGLQLVVIEDHRAPVVQQMVWYRAGSGDEPPGSSGIAHFLEHLMFKATDSLEAGEFSQIVAANGGQDNAFTSYDYTAYFQRVAADRLGTMMEMEADRMENLRLTEDVVRTERDVILEERNQRIDNNPGALFNEQMRAVQYYNSPYKRPVIGWRHEMQTLDLSDALDFYRLHYAPNNAIVVVAGDVEPDAVRVLAEETYGQIPANPDLRPRDRPQEPPQLAARRLTLRDARVAQPYLSRSYLAPPRAGGAQEHAAALTLLAEILGGGTTSYLAEKLEFDAPVAVHTAAYYSGLALGRAGFDLVVVPGADVGLEEAEAALDAALADFLEQGVDPEQLERIKFQWRAAQIYARDNIEGLANRYGSALATGLALEDVEDWPEVIQGVSGDDIMEAARDLLRPETSVTGWLMRSEEDAQ